MKTKLLPYLLVVLVAIMGGCVGDDIDNLQEQIDDLSGKVTELEQSQQEALLSEIAKLQATIATLQASMESGDAELAEQYSALLNNLELLEDEVANNASAVYYGNLLTDADFTAVAAQGAIIVTGKVIPTMQSHIDAMSSIKMVGGDLLIKGGSTLSFSTIEAVGGTLGVSGISETDVTISFPALASVGDDFYVTKNSGLKSVTAGSLILIDGELSISMNDALESLTLSALDKVRGIEINEYNEASWGAGLLSQIDLSSCNVDGNVSIEYISGGSISLGNIAGNLTVDNAAVTEFNILGESVEGDFTFTNNSSISLMNVSSIKTIEGNINISFNAGGGSGVWSATTTDFNAAFPAFEGLETINGDVLISGNTTNSIEAFNNVTTFTGSLIDIQSNGFEVNLLSIFNKLETAGSSSWSYVNISVYGSYAWFDSFAMLQKAGVVNVNVVPTMDPLTFEYDTNLRIDGFDALTQATSVELFTPKATSFSIFASLDHLTSWGTDLKIEMPEDETLGFCSMAGFFNKYNTDPTKYVVEFGKGWGNTIDPATAIEQLLAPCGI